MVSNYSFENVISGFNCANSPTPQAGPGNPGQTDLENYWNQIDNWTCPDKKFGCSGAGSADCKCDVNIARSGTHYGSCTNREYICQELLQTINSGETFYYEFYVLASGGGVFLGAGIKLFDERPKQCNYAKLDPHSNDEPQIKIVNIDRDGVWHKVSGFLVANQPFNWIALGTFVDDKNYTQIILWDDIKIFNLGTNQCPSQWLFENTIFEHENRIYQASDKIIAGENVDVETINGPVTVKSDAHVIFKAGNQIVLEPGFSTEDGAYFETLIEPCSPNPCPYIPPALNDVLVCDPNPVTIGNPAPEAGIYYSWSPSTYLDNPNSANPVFTPPTGSGIIEYTVTITSICGFFISYSGPFPSIAPSITETVTVNYNTNPNPNPSVLISNTQTADYDFSFDFTIGNDTEEYCIQIIEQGTGDVAYSNCFEVGTGSCCSLSFNYNMLSDLEKDNFSICKDYTIIVAAKNHCFSNYASDQFDWNRNDNFSLTFIPNVISIANPFEGYYTNGVNDEFCIDGTGIDYWDLGVFNTAFPSQYFAKYNGHFDNSPECIWNGRAGTNQNVSLSSTPGTSASSGFAYNFILEVTGCNTSQISTGIINVFWDIPPQMTLYTSSIDGNAIGISDTISSQNQLINNEIIKPDLKIHVFPNPSKGIFTIFYPKNIETENITLSVYDNIGQQILITDNSSNSIDLNNYSSGIYFLVVKTNEGIFREKIVKN